MLFKFSDVKYTKAHKLRFYSIDKYFLGTGQNLTKTLLHKDKFECGDEIVRETKLIECDLLENHLKKILIKIKTQKGKSINKQKKLPIEGKVQG